MLWFWLGLRFRGRDERGDDLRPIEGPVCIGVAVQFGAEFAEVVHGREEKSEHLFPLRYAVGPGCIEECFDMVDLPTDDAEADAVRCTFERVVGAVGGVALIFGVVAFFPSEESALQRFELVVRIENECLCEVFVYGRAGHLFRLRCLGGDDELEGDAEQLGALLDGLDKFGDVLCATAVLVFFASPSGGFRALRLVAHIVEADHCGGAFDRVAKAAHLSPDSVVIASAKLSERHAQSLNILGGLFPEDGGEFFVGTGKSWSGFRLISTVGGWCFVFDFELRGGHEASHPGSVGRGFHLRFRELRCRFRVRDFELWWCCLTGDARDLAADRGVADFRRFLRVAFYAEFRHCDLTGDACDFGGWFEFLEIWLRVFFYEAGGVVAFGKVVVVVFEG